MPRPSMYQTINLYHAKRQLYTTTCTTTSASTMHQNLYQTVHQPYITIVPNCALTMHHNLFHMPQPSTMYINTIPSTNLVPYHVPTMYLNHITQSCHTPYAIGYTKQVLSMVYLNQVPTSPRDVSHTRVSIYQVYSSTMYQYQ